MNSVTSVQGGIEMCWLWYQPHQILVKCRVSSSLTSVPGSPVQTTWTCAFMYRDSVKMRKRWRWWVTTVLFRSFKLNVLPQNDFCFSPCRKNLWCTTPWMSKPHAWDSPNTNGHNGPFKEWPKLSLTVICKVLPLKDKQPNWNQVWLFFIVWGLIAPCNSH